MLWSASGSSSPVSSRTCSSISPTICSASSSRPWMNSQRGLSGTLRRTSRIPTPRVAPMMKASRQPKSAANSAVSSRAMEARAPPAAPSQ